GTPVPIGCYRASPRPPEADEGQCGRQATRFTAIQNRAQDVGTVCSSLPRGRYATAGAPPLGAWSRGVRRGCQPRHAFHVRSRLREYLRITALATPVCRQRTGDGQGLVLMVWR